MSAGGFTGAALIIHAIRAATRPLDIEVIEPAAELGRGIAYGTMDPSHRINVPSDRMSLFKEQPEDLTRWLYSNGLLPDKASTDSRGHHYVARSAFGTYVLDTLTRTISTANFRHRLRHHRARAVAIRPDGRGWAVELSSEERLTADKVALCTGHSAPVLPCPVSNEALQHSGFIRNAWEADAISAVGPRDSVLVVGTGLSMADVVASLSDAGHQGPVTAISRLISVDVEHGKLTTTLRRPGMAPARSPFDAVVLCTGPGKVLERDTLISQLLNLGLAQRDEVGDGLVVDQESRLISREGAAQTSLLALGPLTRGSFGEMTGAPDIARQIERIATTVVSTD